MTALSGHEPQIKISIPAAASRLLGALRRAGFEAYVVGGCVRDSLLGRTPGDWDICTSARPEQVRAVFSAYRQILTGEKHGTVAVIVGGTPYEITTYRVDGQYHDSRHPDAVQFVPQVQPDLARRDFTINAMAYAPGEGLIDLYGGRSDLHACLMRCVGDPEERFAEDALRILRAVRLAAQLDFALEEATERAALDMRPDVVYLDPMFPGRTKSAAVKKKFQLIHGLERPTEPLDEESLLQAALAARPRKVVIKRPVKGPYLAGVKPSHSIAGKAVRYDCIVPPR